MGRHNWGVCPGHLVTGGTDASPPPAMHGTAPMTRDQSGNNVLSSTAELTPSHVLKYFPNSAVVRNHVCFLKDLRKRASEQVGEGQWETRGQGDDKTRWKLS